MKKFLESPEFQGIVLGLFFGILYAIYRMGEL